VTVDGSVKLPPNSVTVGKQARCPHRTRVPLCSWHVHLAADDGFPASRGQQVQRQLPGSCVDPVGGVARFQALIGT
jgi:hypothetical protein